MVRLESWDREVGTVESSEIGHPSLGQVLKVTDFCCDGHAVIQIEAVLIQDKSSKRRICLDPEDVRSVDCLSTVQLKHVSSFQCGC
jgi:hypothetical protein